MVSLACRLALGLSCALLVAAYYVLPLDSELVREREMVVELDQPGAHAVKLLGVPVKLSRTPGAPAGPGPALGEHTDEVLAALGYSPDDVAALKESGAVAGPASGARGSFMA